MAYSLITPLKVSDMSTNAAHYKTSSFGIKLTTNGAYIKTGGTSRIDPTRLLFFITRNSSKASTACILAVVPGSTAGARDYQPGSYSTLNALNITMPADTHKPFGISGRVGIEFFFIPEAARFCDTDQYIKFKVPSSKLTSGHAGGVSVGSRMGALYLAMGSH